MKPAVDDPFGERTPPRARTRLSVLGGDVAVESTDATLLELTVDAFGGLPRHRLGGRPRKLKASLVLTHHKRTWPRGAEPPRPVLSAGNGLLCATVDAGNYAVVDVSTSRALVCVSAAMLRHAYHARYELIEFAILTLASRAQSLVPLHAACIGSAASGLLLMGPSGAGKSTLGLHALAGGMRLLSEDSAFVALAGLKITAAPSYLYLQREALAFLPPGGLRQRILQSPRIRRRSGVVKYQLNLREMRSRIPRSPLKLAATVFLSRRSTRRQSALKPLNQETFLRRLRREQPYASGMSNWGDFERRIARRPAYELLRTEHPDIAVRELRALLG